MAGLKLGVKVEGSESPLHCLRGQAVGVGKVSLGGGSDLDGEPCIGRGHDGKVTLRSRQRRFY